MVEFPVGRCGHRGVLDGLPIEKCGDGRGWDRACRIARNHAGRRTRAGGARHSVHYDVPTPICVRETAAGDGVTSGDKPVIEEAKRVRVSHLWRERDEEK